MTQQVAYQWRGADSSVIRFLVI